MARKYGGRRSASSGAAEHDQGDIRTKDNLLECKGKFGARTGGKPVRSVLVDQFAKIADEAYSEMRIPGIALRFYMPESSLANAYGYVDLMVRLLEDDLAAEEGRRMLEKLVVPDGH